MDAALNWNLPASVPAGKTFTVSFYESPTVGTSPYTVRLYQNGALIATGSGGITHTTVAASPQTLTYMAQGATGATSTKYVNIVAADQAPIGWFDTATGSVPAGGWLSLWGWAADNEKGAPVARVDILIDAVDRGDASLGGFRPDVAAAWTRPDWTYSGWDGRFDTTGLSQAVHTVTMVAWDAYGSATTLGSKNFTVTAPTGDADGDGLPDAWEISYWGNITTAGAFSDNDGDGLNNLEEYLARRSPTDRTEGGKFQGNFTIQLKILNPPTQTFNVNSVTWVIQ
jgi:hypothetical protein